ncbi:MAG: DUF4115 domain-containing protein [Bacteroidota bacterium]|nr:DUF4115 domain-containing protein [Bacteroidota bacterium]MDP4233798.1 DUF4115 domain-containing protein [Bacteroidota bacterium]MDP4242437.1 DUF4115 domain-containing protein [Bacteroidota bacterium]MDP4287559.1 DUF4115 domain-containing protein [Bacteroidota bacterium]
MVTDERFQALGEELRRARIARGRSLDDIAATTKIHRRHLEAIESGDLTRIPQGPYVKAFVREFARAVGVAVPNEFALLPGAPPASPKDPKVVSHLAGERSAPISDVARETARMANTAVRSAVKSVTKTTESVVQMVETGGKEAIEVLTSKSLWDEAENVRRERHGLPPLPIEQKASEIPIEEAASVSSPRVRPVRTISKRATYGVIALLALLFGTAIFFAIRMYRTEGASTAVKGEYIPAPVETPTPSPGKKRTASSNTAATTSPTVPIKDSIHFILRATQPVWVSIAPDGVPAYRGQLRAGETRTFRAAEKILLDIGNQKSVEMQLDGQRLSNLPTIQNSSVVIRGLVLMRNHVSLGGRELNWKSLTSVPTPAAPIVAAPAAPIVPKSVPGKAPSKAKPTARTVKTPSIQPVRPVPVKNGTKPQLKPSQAKNSPSNLPSATPKSKQPKSKRSKGPTTELHSVEPVPPGP